MERRKRKKLKDQTSRGPSSSGGVVGGVGGAGGSSSAVPDALHLRFLTELHQLETVNNTQRLLDELEQIKRSSFENHRGLESVQAEMTNQRKLIEEQNNVEKLNTAQVFSLVSLTAQYCNAVVMIERAARSLLL